MLLAQVESFLEVVRTGSLTRAADALFVTQPTLTERLKSLEAELGKPLFARTRRYGLQLTAAGEAFLPHAERLVASAGAAIEAVAQADHLTPASLTIGVASVVGTSVLAQGLARIRSNERTSAIEVRTGKTSDVVKMVLRKDVDFGFSRPVRNAQIELSPIYTEELVAVIAPDHPLTRASSPHVREIAAEPLIVVAETVTYGYLSRAITRGGGTPPRVPIQVDNTEMARVLVESRLGIAFLPLGSVADDLSAKRLARLRLQDVPPIHARITGLRRFDAPHESRMLESLIGYLREAGSRLEPAATSVAIAHDEEDAVLRDARRSRVTKRVSHARVRRTHSS